MGTAEKTLIVDAPVGDVYQRWTQFDRFPEFMENIKSVTKTADERKSHWVVNGPLGTNIEFDADTTTLEENKRIAWNSRDSGDITTSGQVTFTELGTGQTQVHVILKYDPPAGFVGEIVARLFSNPQAQLDEDMARFSKLVNRTNANPQSTGESSGKGDTVNAPSKHDREDAA